MPNYLQPISTGIDYSIQNAQSRMYQMLLLGKWGLGSDTAMSFGRVYRNNTEDGYIPEAFYDGAYISSDGTSSRGGLFFEYGKAVTFWAVVDTVKKVANADDVAKVELYCFADMSVVKPGANTTSVQRLDEVIANDLENFITCNGCGFVVTDNTRDIDKVLERWSGTAKKSTITRNMSGTNNAAPSFCAIKLSLELRYSASDGQ